MKHDSLMSYEPDTFVADEPERWHPPLVDDGEVEVKVFLDGLWHRELDHVETVCEAPIPHVGQWRVPTKQKQEGEMCPGCFFPSEIARAQAIRIVDEEDRRASEDAVAPSRWRETMKSSLGDEIERQRKRSDRIASLAKPKKPNGKKEP